MMQYALFNLYRSEFAEILGVSQLAPGIVLLSPLYGANFLTKPFFRFPLSFNKGPCDYNKYST